MLATVSDRCFVKSVDDSAMIEFAIAGNFSFHHQRMKSSNGSSLKG